MPPRTPSDIYGETVDRLVGAASADARIRALWLEGASPSDVRRPYRSLEVHLTCDEPDFSGLLADAERLLAGTGTLSGQLWSDVPRFARQLEADLDGAPIRLIIEKSSLLAKRPRSAVASLVDKTGHLTHVMDFSKCRR